MTEIKVSQLPEASQINDDDLIMIVQSGTNKKITKANAKFASGDEVSIGTTEPVEDEKLWINPNEVPSGTGSYISNVYSDATDKAYSCHYINNLDTPTLLKERNYASGWTTECNIPSDYKWIYIVVNGVSCENVLIPLSLAKTYTTASPYFIANQSGLVYQFAVGDSNDFVGLFRSEGGTNTSIKIYGIK